MAEYSSDEERFAAFVNFFKDHKNTLVIGFLLLAFILTSSIGYKSYSSSQNLKAAEIYDAWSAGCLLYTSPSPRDRQKSRMPSSA